MTDEEVQLEFKKRGASNAFPEKYHMLKSPNNVEDNGKLFKLMIDFIKQHVIVHTSDKVIKAINYSPDTTMFMVVYDYDIPVKFMNPEVHQKEDLFLIKGLWK